MESGSVHLLVFGGGQRLVGLGRLVLQVGQGCSGVLRIPCPPFPASDRSRSGDAVSNSAVIGCCVGVDDVRRARASTSPGQMCAHRVTREQPPPAQDNLIWLQSSHSGSASIRMRVRRATRSIGFFRRGYQKVGSAAASLSSNAHEGGANLLLMPPTRRARRWPVLR